MRNIRKVVAAVGVAVVASLATVSSVALAESSNGSKAQPSHRTSSLTLTVHFNAANPGDITSPSKNPGGRIVERARSRSKLRTCNFRN
jgi:hypothetical protein